MDRLTFHWTCLEASDVAPSTSGLYAVWDDQYVHGSDMLVYLGRADNLCNRLEEHHEWISRCRNPVIVVAGVADLSIRNRAEKLLIYVLQPIYNQKEKDIEPIVLDLQISNTGFHRNMLPIIDSNFPWFNKTK